MKLIYHNIWRNPVLLLNTNLELQVIQNTVVKYNDDSCNQHNQVTYYYSTSNQKKHKQTHPLPYQI